MPLDSLLFDSGISRRISRSILAHFYQCSKRFKIFKLDMINDQSCNRLIQALQDWNHEIKKLKRKCILCPTLTFIVYMYGEVRGHNSFFVVFNALTLDCQLVIFQYIQLLDLLLHHKRNSSLQIKTDTIIDSRNRIGPRMSLFTLMNIR